MVTVRKARVDDLPVMLEQAKEFYEYHPLPIKYNAAHTAGIILDMIEEGVTFVAEKDGEIIGGIGGAYIPNLFDPTYVTLAEMYLWVVKEHRKTRAMHHLVKAFMEAGKKADSTALCHTKLTPALGRIYTKRYGCELMETTYTKET